MFTGFSVPIRDSVRPSVEAAEAETTDAAQTEEVTIRPPTTKEHWKALSYYTKKPMKKNYLIMYESS